MKDAYFLLIRNMLLQIINFILLGQDGLASPPVEKGAGNIEMNSKKENTHDFPPYHVLVPDSKQNQQTGDLTENLAGSLDEIIDMFRLKGAYSM